MSDDIQKRSAIKTIKYFFSGFSRKLGIVTNLINLIAIVALGSTAFYGMQFIWSILVYLGENVGSIVPTIRPYISEILSIGSWMMKMFACGAFVCMILIYWVNEAGLAEKRKEQEQERRAEFRDSFDHG